MKYNAGQYVRLLSTHHILLRMWLEADKLAVTQNDKKSSQSKRPNCIRTYVPTFFKPNIEVITLTAALKI